MRAATGKVGCEKVGKGAETINGVWEQRGEPFQGWACEGSRERFTKHGVFKLYKATWVTYTLRCLSGSVSPA